MSIPAAEFIRRVIAGQDVRGEQVEGDVMFGSCELLTTDWSGCRFDAALRIRDCFTKRTLSLMGASARGDVLVHGLSFKAGPAQKAGLILRGLVCEGNVCLAEVSHSHADIAKINLTSYDSLDELVSGEGMDLSGMQVAQSLQITDCTRRPDGISTVLSLDFTRVGTFAEIGAGTTFQLWGASHFHVQGNCLLTLAVDPVADGVEQAGGEAHSPVLVLTSMACDGNLSIAIESSKNTDLLLSGARIGGHLKIASAADCKGRIQYLELDRVSTGRDAIIDDFDLAQGKLDGMRCDANVSLKNLRGFECKDSKGKAKPARLSLVDVAVSGNLLMNRLDSFTDINATRARTTGDLTLASSTRLGAIRLEHGQANVVEVNQCEAASLDGADLRANGLRIWQVRLAGTIDLMRARIQGGAIVEGLVAEKLDLTAAVVGVRLRIDPERGDVADQLQRELRTRSGLPQVTTLKRLCLDDCDIPLADLSGAFMTEASLQGQPAISARRIRAKSQLRVRADQFVCEYALPMPGQGKETPAVLDLTQAQIGELDLGEPLPASITLRGATIENWGLKDCSPADGKARSIARCYDDILSRADAFELRQYIRIETELENAGQRNDADELHRLWRDRARKQLPRGVRRSVSWLHSVALGYGTQRGRLVGAMLGVGVVALAAGIYWYDASFQVSSSLLATLAECGAPCADRPLPTLASSWPGKIWDSTQLVLRHGVPLIDLNLGVHLEPKPGSAAAHAVSLVRAIGWITWPVLLTSLLASFFPKRHQA